MSKKIYVKNTEMASKDYVDSSIGAIDLSNYLAKDNTTSFTPINDYNPSTKKYVDDNITLAEQYANKTFVIETETKSWLTDTTSIGKFNNWYKDYINGHLDEFIIKTTVKDENGTQGRKLKTFRLTNFELSDTNYLIFSSFVSANGSNNKTGTLSFSVRITIVNEEVTALSSNTDGNNIVAYQTIPTSAYDELFNTRQLALSTTNTKAYTPTGDYNPATKKYVDDIVGNINTILATLTTPTQGGSV